jgi:predicted glycosyltransferase
MAAGEVLFYVQHLLGIGHVYRALRISNALIRAGFVVDLVLGGKPLPLPEALARVHQLPPIGLGSGGFTDLVDDAGNPIDAVFRETRVSRLLEIYETTRPSVILIEAFPFGRRQMRFELEPLLKRARIGRARPLVASSVRDILQRSRKPGRDIEMVEMARSLFDLVIVHGDSAFTELENGLPEAAKIQDLIRYSGLVGPEGGARYSGKTYAVVVSAGGGAVGTRLLRTAIAAKPFSVMRDRAWAVIAGPNMIADDRAIVAAEAATQGIQVLDFVEGFPEMLGSADLSISQAGYNTVADLLTAGCAAVVVPSAAGGETEQTERAAGLAANRLAVAVTEAEVSPEKLAVAIAGALRLPKRPRGQTLPGAMRTARIVKAELDSLRRRQAQRGEEGETTESVSEGPD